MDKKTEPVSITTTIYSGSIVDFDLSSSCPQLKELEQKNMDQLFRKSDSKANYKKDKNDFDYQNNAKHQSGKNLNFTKAAMPFNIVDPGHYYKTLKRLPISQEMMIHGHSRKQDGAVSYMEKVLATNQLK